MEERDRESKKINSFLAFLSDLLVLPRPKAIKINYLHPDLCSTSNKTNKLLRHTRLHTHTHTHKTHIIHTQYTREIERGREGEREGVKVVNFSQGLYFQIVFFSIKKYLR